MRIDAHQHFWQLARGDYGWLTPDLAELYRDFLPPDLAPLLQRHAIDGAVAVQAATTAAETDFLLALAARTPWILGVVGWVDLLAMDAPAQLASRARDPWFKGVRPMLQDIPDVDWMLQPALAPALRALVAHDLAFDALVRPAHLPNLRVLLLRHPDLRVVIDHGAKPDIAGGDLARWREDIASIARETRASCKLSGLVTEAATDWQPHDIAPVVAHLLDVFGPERLLWGSDWPVLLLAADHERWCALTDALLARCTAPERDAIMGGNAMRFYRLSAPGAQG
jgi:L-fuconolactonase